MFLEFEINSIKYKIDTDKPLSISIPLDFHGEQPNAFGVPKAEGKAVKTDRLIGDMRLGGSCNFEQYKFIPHCNGTHTECIGHITRERISIQNILKDAFIPLTLISVAPEKALDSNENYIPEKQKGDMFITKKILRNSLKDYKHDFLKGLIIRTLPNDDSKKIRNYTENPPPFFSLEAMEFISSQNVKHLLVDVPSLDRMSDEGKLSAHRIFWENGADKTITEMIYVPDSIKDGTYILNLQIADFVADASPSRPVIYSIFLP